MVNAGDARKASIHGTEGKEGIHIPYEDQGVKVSVTSFQLLYCATGKS